jgi:probable phosphoglycerate mutase
MTHTTANTTLILIRHGETEWNLLRKHQGHLDSSLTPTGVAQAQAFAAVLRDNRPIDALYASDLGRTMATARIIAAPLKLEIIPQPDLREICLGLLQGLTLEEFKRAHPELHRQYLQHEPDFTLPGGESLRRFQHRTMACLNRIVAAHSGQTVLAVTHGGNLGCVFREVFELPFTAPRRFSIPNLAYNQFTVVDNEWRLENWGALHHLRNLQVLDELG